MLDATAYYDALKGDTVIALNPLGNSDMQNRICFFAPVEKDGEIAGVLVGNFDDATLKKFMNTKLFGYTSTAFICSESGEIVANSVGILQRTTLTSYLKEHNLMDDNGIAELRNSLKNKNQYAFEIHGKNYESSAYMMRLENSGLILVQAFPVEATNMQLADFAARLADVSARCDFPTGISLHFDGVMENPGSSCLEIFFTKTVSMQSPHFLIFPSFS